MGIIKNVNIWNFSIFHIRIEIFDYLSARNRDQYPVFSVKYYTLFYE